MKKLTIISTTLLLFSVAASQPASQVSYLEQIAFTAKVDSGVTARKNLDYVTAWGHFLQLEERVQTWPPGDAADWHLAAVHLSMSDLAMLMFSMIDDSRIMGDTLSAAIIAEHLIPIVNHAFGDPADASYYHPDWQVTYKKRIVPIYQDAGWINKAQKLERDIATLERDIAKERK